METSAAYSGQWVVSAKYSAEPSIPEVCLKPVNTRHALKTQCYEIYEHGTWLEGGIHTVVTVTKRAPQPINSGAMIAIGVPLRTPLVEPQRSKYTDTTKRILNMPQSILWMQMPARLNARMSRAVPSGTAGGMACRNW